MRQSPASAFAGAWRVRLHREGELTAAGGWQRASGLPARPAAGFLIGRQLFQFIGGVW